MADKKQESDRYIVPAVDQASRILSYLAQAESAYVSLTDICARVGVHKSKAFTILHTLQKFGLIQKNVDGKGYGLGPGLLGLSRRFLDNLSAPRLARPMLEELAKRTASTAALGLISDRNVFVADKHEGGRPIGFTIRVGSRFPLTYGCHGKAIAAFLPRKELGELLESEKLYFHGDPGRFDREKLMEEIGQCRRRWYAEDLEEMVPGLNFVAAPVLGLNGRPVGYVVAMGLPSPDAVRQTGPLVAETGKALSRLLGAPVEGIREIEE